MSLTKKITRDNNILYLNVFKDKFVERSDADNPDAVKREYETTSGDKKVKWEVQHFNLTGRITDFSFKDGDFGEQFVVTICNGDETAKLYLEVEKRNRYFFSFANKIPNIDLNKDVVLNAYDSVWEGNPSIGISVKQDGEKIPGAYWDGKKSYRGYPSVSEKDKSSYDSDDWKMFFIKVKKFFKKEIEKVVVPAYTSNVNESLTAKAMRTIGKDPGDDIPF